MKKTIIIHTIFLVLLAGIAFLLLSPGLVGQKISTSHDGVVGLAKIVFWKDALTQGIFYPRWFPMAVGGQGIPTFVFYQPGFFFFSSLFSWLPMFPFLTLYISIWALLVLGMWGVYCLVNTYADNKGASFITAVFFAITPYIYINVNVRGSFSELMAMLLSPLPILCLLKFKNAVIKNSRKGSFISLVGLVLFLCCVMIAHPVGLIMVPVLLLAFSIPCFLDICRQKRKKFMLNVIYALLTACIMTAFYWGPAFSLKEFIALSNGMSGAYMAASNVVSLKDLLCARSWGFDAFGAVKNGMLTPIGLPHFLAACFGTVCFWRNRFVRSAFFIFMGLIVFMLPVSTVVWKSVFFLRYLQFPWRLLSFTALPLAVCFSGLVLWLFKRLPYLAAWVIACLVLSGVFFWYPILSLPDNALSARSIINFNYIKRARTSFDTLSSEHIDLPVFCIQPDHLVFKNNVYCTQGHVMLRALSGNNPYLLHYETYSFSDMEVVINQLYFPGWRVILDGEDIPDTILRSRLKDDGKIRFWLPKGTHVLEAYYAGVPGEAFYWILGGVFFVGFIIVNVLALRKTEK